MSYQCPSCELRFSFRNERDYHLREDHPRRPTVDPAGRLDGAGQKSGPAAVETAPSAASAAPVPTDEALAPRHRDQVAASARAPWWRRWRATSRG